MSELINVGIIMSVYNGAKYLEEQLDSIAHQEKVNICLFVRDDGSNDNSIEILNKYKSKFTYVEFFSGKNIGVSESFYSVAKYAFESKTQCEYYAFSDQDDIWLPDKVITGIRHIRDYDHTKPNLYFSNLWMVDNTCKNFLGLLLNKSFIITSRYNALASIYIYGCTCVFNKIALKYFLKISENMKYIYHDNWIYSVCIFCGNVYFDSSSHILYRQTSSNASGRKVFGLSLWIKRFKKIFLKGNSLKIHLFESIAKEIKKNFIDELNKDDILYLTRISSYRRNFLYWLWLLFTKRMKTKSFSKNICIIGRILLRML